MNVNYETVYTFFDKKAANTLKTRRSLNKEKRNLTKDIEALDRAK